MKIRGRVTEGNRIGRNLGYPTANIEVSGSVEAPDGVYAAAVRFDGKEFGAMANLGVKPTFTEGEHRVLELHLLGFSDDLYGKELEAELLEFIRPERKFASPDELRAQIKKDEELIKKLLDERFVIRNF